jgi:hypothetical protein
MPSCDLALKELRAQKDVKSPFYSAATNGVSFNADDANMTISCLQDADDRDDIFIAFSHDDALLDVVDFFPSTADYFMQKGWVDKTRWVFLRDFLKFKADPDGAECQAEHG